MTCIVGLAHEGKVYIGGDSASSNGWSLRTAAMRKVFFTSDKELLIGFTDTWRFGQILQYQVAPPPREQGDDDLTYLVSRYIPTVQQALKDNGYMTTENGQDSAGGAVLGYRGKVYELSPDFGLTCFADNIAAVGIGWMFALGALRSFTQDDFDPEMRVLDALQVAGDYADGVRPPYYVEVLP